MELTYFYKSFSSNTVSLLFFSFSISILFVYFYKQGAALFYTNTFL